MKLLSDSTPLFFPEAVVVACAIPVSLSLSRVRGRARCFLPLALLSASADGEETAARDMGVRLLPDPPFNGVSAGKGVVDYHQDKIIIMHEVEITLYGSIPSSVQLYLDLASHRCPYPFPFHQRYRCLWHCLRSQTLYR